MGEQVGGKWGGGKFVSHTITSKRLLKLTT